MKKSLLALSLAAILLTGLTGCDTADKVSSATSGTGTSTQVTTMGKVTKVVVGEDQTMVLDENNNLWATGQNDVGEFGNESTVPAGTSISSFVKIAEDVVDFDSSYFTDADDTDAGDDAESYTLIVKEDGYLYAAGSNAHGQLGNTDTSTVLKSFTKVTIKDSSNNDVVVKQVAAGNLYSLVADDNGNVYGTGDNYFGQLGLATFGSGALYTTYTKVDLGGKSASEIKTNNQMFSWDNYAKNLASTAIITTDNKLLVAGQDGWGSLGQGDNGSVTSFTDSGLTDVTDVALGPLNSYAIAGGELYGTGDHYSGQLPGLTASAIISSFAKLTVPAGYTLTGVVAGRQNVILLTSAGSLSAGKSVFGELGTGTSAGTYSTFTAIASGIVPSGGSLCGTNGALISSSGYLYMSGDNSYGQFGNGTITATNVFTKVTE